MGFRELNEDEALDEQGWQSEEDPRSFRKIQSDTPIDPVGPSRFQSFMKRASTPGRMTMGGALKAVEGLATFPTDVFAALGGPKGRGTKRYEVISDKIRAAIPNIDPNSTYEDLGQKLVQYGLPAITAVGAATKIAQGSPWAIRFLSSIFSGGLSDFLVADPTDPTLGDWIGGPTESRPGESNLSKRAKIGAEGTVLAGSLEAPIKVAKGVYKWLGTRVFPTDKMIRDSLSGALYDQAIDPEKAILEIKDNLRKLQENGFQPTTGTMTKDLGLLASEKSAVAQNRVGGTATRMGERQELNLQHISDELESVTASRGGDPEKARSFFIEHVQNFIENKEGAAALASDAVKRVSDEIKNDIYMFSKLNELEPKASTILNEQVESSLNRVTQERKALYDVIDPGRTVVLEKDRIAEAWKTLKKKAGPADLTPSQIPKELKQQMLPFLKKKNPKDLTFYDLNNHIKPQVSAAIQKAREEKLGGAVVERLVAFKKAIQYESKLLSLENTQAGQAAKQAEDYHREVYSPMFNEFMGKNYKKAIRKAGAIPPSKVAGKFLATNSGANEMAAQLELILSKAPAPDVAKSAVGDYMAGSLAKQLFGVENPEVAKKVVYKFLASTENTAVFKRFPGAKKKISEFYSKIGTRLEMQDSLGEVLGNAKARIRDAKTRVGVSQARYWVNSNPSKAITNVFNSGDPERSMAELVELAKRDPAGMAIDGLKESFRQMVESPAQFGGVRGTKELMSGANFEVLNSRMSRLLNHEPSKKAIVKLMGEADVRTLEALHKKMGIMNRINWQVPATSQTAQLEEAVRSGQILLFSMFGIVKGRGLFTVSRLAQKALGRDPVEKAWTLLADAQLDPELAKTLLMEASKANAPVIEYKIMQHFMNNAVPGGDQP